MHRFVPASLKVDFANGTGRWVSAVLCCGLAIVGCNPKAEFLSTSCQRVPNGPDPRALEFTSTFQVNNLEGQQVVYSVGLLSAGGKPIRSKDGRYQDAEGQVAASRALVVAKPAWRFENATVAIPWDQLELKSATPPAMAEFSVSLPDGTLLASEQIRLPFGAPRRGTKAPPPGSDEKVAAAKRPGPPPKTDSKPKTKPGEARGGTSQPPQPAANSGDQTAAPAAQPSKRPPSKPDSSTRRPPAFVPPKKGPPDPIRNAAKPKPASQPAVEAPTVAGSASAPKTTSRPAAIDPLGARRYVVRDGDTLPAIAAATLGDAKRWPEILELNQDLLKSSDNLDPGIELWIPGKERE